MKKSANLSITEETTKNEFNHLDLNPKRNIITIIDDDAIIVDDDAFIKNTTPRSYNIMHHNNDRYGSETEKESFQFNDGCSSEREKENKNETLNSEDQKNFLEKILEEDNVEYFLESENNTIKELNDDLANLKKLHHKISQDLDYEKIQTNNLKYVNLQLESSFKTLQANKFYISKLLHKKKGATARIKKLITTVKHLQNIIKQKNATISRCSYNNNKLKEQAARIIRESCGI